MKLFRFLSNTPKCLPIAVIGLTLSLAASALGAEPETVPTEAAAAVTAAPAAAVEGTTQTPVAAPTPPDAVPPSAVPPSTASAAAAASPAPAIEPAAVNTLLPTPAAVAPAPPALAPAPNTPAVATVTQPVPGLAPRDPQTRERDALRAAPRGTYFQLRAMGLFGVNTTHEFSERCPESDCSVTLPLGLGVGFATGWEKKGWAVEFLGLFLFDNTTTTYRHPVTHTVLVPAAEGSASGNATGSASGSTSGEADGGFGIDIGSDGIDISGDISGALPDLGDITGSADGNVSGDAALVEQRVLVNQRERIDVRRVGAALGLGVRRNFGRRPARLTLGATGGILFRGISSSDLKDSNAPTYRAPFAMLDVGFVFGKRGGFHLGMFGMAEFPPDVSLTNVPGIGSVRVSNGPQYFIGPILAIQWGPRSAPRPEQHPPEVRELQRTQ